LHAPPAQLSAVQATPSSGQAKPLAAAKTRQPATGLQTSIVQAFPSSQTVAPPLQLAPVQLSPVVQALPSSQLPILGTWLQGALPLSGSQTPVVQGLLSSQYTGAPKHKPAALQASPEVQALPSSQARPVAVVQEPKDSSGKQARHGEVGLTLPADQQAP
jgi:hypothetical protein